MNKVEYIAKTVVDDYNSLMDFSKHYLNYTKGVIPEEELYERYKEYREAKKASLYK